MDRATAEQDLRAAVQCVAELRVEIPLERLAAIQQFYTEVIGLPPWPRRAQIVGGWGAGDPQKGVYFQFRHDPVVDPARRRLTILVSSLAELRRRLGERAWPYWSYRGFGMGDDRALVNDPAGHLVEIRESSRIM